MAHANRQPSIQVRQPEKKARRFTARSIRKRQERTRKWIRPFTKQPDKLCKDFIQDRSFLEIGSFVHRDLGHRVVEEPRHCATCLGFWLFDDPMDR